MTPAARAVLASMSDECQEALTALSVPGMFGGLSSSAPIRDGFWHHADGVSAFVPADPTAIVADAARMVGEAGWRLDGGARCRASVRRSAERGFGGEVLSKSGPDPLTAALELFKAAHGTVSA